MSYVGALASDAHISFGCSNSNAASPYAALRFKKEPFGGFSLSYA